MFQVRNRQWSRKFPNFTRPFIRSYFSVNKERQFVADLSELQYLKCGVNNTSPNFNLNDGYEERITKSDVREKIDFILKCIINDYDKFSNAPGSERWLEPEFISFRNALLTIACTPYEKFNDWIICAAKFHGTIFLCGMDTQNKIEEKANRTEQTNRLLAWGLKFEQYLFSDHPNVPPDTSVPNNEREEFCCMFSAKLNGHLLVYGAEIDGIDANEVINECTDLNTCTLVEAKTRKKIRNKYDMNAFRKKVVHWWCQSFLAGIDKVLCGFRNNNGIIKEMKYISLSELRRMGEGYWNPSICMNFCDEFLSYVKKTVQKEHDQCIYKFYWKPGENVDMEILPAEHEYNFLPKWFCNEINRLHNVQCSKNVL